MDHNALLLLLFLLLLFDRGSTAYGVRRWGWRHEVNPLFRRLFESGSRAQMLIVDVTVTGLIMAVAWAVEEAAFVFALCFAAVAVNNAVAIFRLMRADIQGRH
jgi:hypothetical protein